MTSARRIGFLVLLLALAPRTLPAQQPASPLVPLDDVTYVYVDALVARGALRELSLLDRPYAVAQLRAALAAARAERPALRRWIDAADRAAAKYAARTPADTAADRYALLVAPVLGATAQTTGARDLLAGGEDAPTGGARADLRVALETPRVVAAVRGTIDQRLAHDPDFRPTENAPYPARVEDAYVRATGRWVEGFFGRTARSWGPPLLDGLIVGRAAYTYDHAFLKLGGRALNISVLAAQLDDSVVARRALPDGRLIADPVIRRWFTAHRLAGRWRALEFAAEEAVVYGGIGRGFDFAYLNPLNVFYATQVNEDRSGNVQGAASLLWRSRSGVVLAAQGQADGGLFNNVLPSDCDESRCFPDKWAATLSATGLPIPGTAQRWFAAWTAVSTLAYRTYGSGQYERAVIRGVGLGRANADYDELRAGIDLLLPPTLPVTLYVARRRQGEGDINAPHPTLAEQQVAPITGMLQGIVEHSWRAALTTSARVGGVELSVDAGVNHVTNADHVEGARRIRPEGRLRLSVDPPFGWRRTFTD